MTKMNLGPIELDRAAGVIVASAAGDALGAGYEFGPQCDADEVEMRQGSLTGRPAGSWTDDTDMAICVAEVAAKGERLDLSIEGRGAIGLRFLDWYNSHPPDIGNQTRAVLSAAAKAGPHPFSECERFEDAAGQYQSSHPEAAGNGSLMRTGPVAIAGLGDDNQLMRTAMAVSALTHQHQLAIEACQLWCMAIDRAVREGRLDGIHDGIALLEETRQDFWRQTIRTAESAPLDALKNNGFVVTALQAAWRAIVSTQSNVGPAHLEAALRAAVAIGGDTDTVAAIAGALLGARYGASAVPFDWRRHLQGWPGHVGHSDLVIMGVLASRKGEPDNIGWPLAEDLLPYYQKHWQPSGYATVLPGHEGVIWGDVGSLATVQANAFVSLCRIGRRQRRGNEHHEIWLMDDDHNADLTFVLEDTADAIESLRHEHDSVFVHCVRSESRTPTVAAAWLVRHRGIDPEAALAMVRLAMPTARPHSALLASLVNVRPSSATVEFSESGRSTEWPDEVTYVTDSSDAGVSTSLNHLGPAAWDQLEVISRGLKGPNKLETAWELVKFLEANSLVITFDWMNWLRFGRDPMERPEVTRELIGSASVEDALRLATGIARAERFSDGCIDRAAESGLLAAIVDRLLQWKLPTE